MARYTVKHHEAIWETTTFEVVVPDPLPEAYDSPKAYILDKMNELMAAALLDESATIESGDSVVNVEDDIEITDEAGKTIHS